MKSNRPMAHILGAWNPQLICTLLFHHLPDSLDGFLASCFLPPGPCCLALTAPPTSTGSSTQASKEVLLARRGLPFAYSGPVGTGRIHVRCVPLSISGKARQCLSLPWASSATHIQQVSQWVLLLIPIQVPRVSLQRGCNPLGDDLMGSRDWIPHRGSLVFTFHILCPFCGLCQLCSRPWPKPRPERL